MEYNEVIRLKTHLQSSMEIKTQLRKTVIIQLKYQVLKGLEAVRQDQACT